ncbi:CAAX prenyl protease-related protein [Verrucomicrobiaceae bacterium N1E253]|uniref:CAAX prenyl protease-related protein n=1 Tax=Oceaniferula marina TaxID=2748318 RepID=A0A851GAL2_9BACT|nr:CAAX prenyl protease-related protein [Oceaniferula marina]NWK54239.1 CAAX prenyl protease-related protein [Oceaniferula marina]
MNHIQAWKEDKTVAHVLPLAAFMLLMIPYQLTGWPEWDHPNAPWWRHYPEQWLYPLQSLIAIGLLLYFRKNYELKWGRGVFLGVFMGVIGIGFWILPTQVHSWLDIEGEPDGFLRFLGVMPRTDGFNPQDLSDKFNGSLWVYWSSLIFRFFRAVVVVSLIEEIFWRGFLMRFLLNPDRDYWKIPFGKPSWKSFLIVTGLFMLAHAPVDYVGAFIFGSLMYWLAVRTKSLLACVVMHGVANLIMGWYAISFGKYGLW